MEDGEGASTGPPLSIMIVPLHSKVLIEPFIGEFTGTLWILEEEKFGTSGTVLACGKGVTELSPGDIVIWEPVSIDLPNKYFPYCYVLLADEDGKTDWVLVEEDAEAVIKEAYGRFIENPSTHDRWVTVTDLNTNESVKFLTSNIRKFGVAEISPNGRLKTDYVEAKMFDIWKGGKYVTLFIMDESQIIGRITSAEPDSN
jgi:hypothetical protein